MSIVSEIGRINTNIANAYAKCVEKGATLPSTENSENLANTIDSISSGGGLDWSAIGYSGTPESVIDDYNYAKQIFDNWDSSQTDLTGKFNNDNLLVYMPLVDTSNATVLEGMFNNCNYLRDVPLLDFSNVTSMFNTFSNCLYLKEVPLFDTSNVTNMRYLFTGCNNLETVPQYNTSKIVRISNAFNNCFNLTDTSLDNILKMCININPNYARAKTLLELGFTSSSYPASRIQALPSYQDFIDAGWTVGY